MRLGETMRAMSRMPCVHVQMGQHLNSCIACLQCVGSCLADMY